LSRAHSEQVLPLGSLMPWLCLVAFIGLLGLCYVNMTQKLKTDGDLCRELEQKVHDLDEKIQVAGGEIIRMTARPALERRREEGFIKMMPVTDARLVRLRPESASAALSMDHAEVTP